MSATPHPIFFHTTRWTMVARAGGHTEQARLALAELCEAYYAPVQQFVRAWCGDADAAQDLTQEFFAAILAKNGLENADQTAGRFRSYLLGAVKHFLIKAKESRQRLKRGGGVHLQSFHEVHSEDEEAAHAVPSLELPPDAQFDKMWALTVLDQALKELESEFIAEGRENHFTVLKPWLTGTEGPQFEAAASLELSPTAVKVAIHRLRQRFRAAIRSKLAQTLIAQANVDEEMSHLLAALTEV